MTELDDYSGNYNPDLEFNDFSKEALIKLLMAYQTVFVGTLGICSTINRRRMSIEEAMKIDEEIYLTVLKKFSLPLVTKALNIKGDDVITMLKMTQCVPDGARKEFYDSDTEIIDRNHVKMTVKKCPTLYYWERNNLDKDIEICCTKGGIEERCFEEFAKFSNPKIKVIALENPPRADKNGTCCSWEFIAE